MGIVGENKKYDVVRNLIASFKNKYQAKRKISDIYI